MFELDVIATDYNGEKPKVIPIEVKSGNWKYRDIFINPGLYEFLNNQ